MDRWADDGVSCLDRLVLKYSSRDEVELLGHGTGGVADLRNTVAAYEEKSPLYGFLRYRRRSVVMKYLPDDCSRLIQGQCCQPSACSASW